MKIVIGANLIEGAIAYFTIIINLQPGSMLMPEPYSNLTQSSSGLVRTPTPDCSATSVGFVFTMSTL